MAMTTGMRQAEMPNLRWPDIDFNRGLAYLATTKNGEPRYCPIPDFVMAELAPLRQVGNGMLFASEIKPGSPVEYKKTLVQGLGAS